MDKEFYKWFVENQELFNISKVEKFCNIKQGSLNKALKRKQERFKYSQNLLVLREKLGLKKIKKNILMINSIQDFLHINNNYANSLLNNDFAINKSIKEGCSIEKSNNGSIILIAPNSDYTSEDFIFEEDEDGLNAVIYDVVNDKYFDSELFEFV